MACILTHSCYYLGARRALLGLGASADAFDFSRSFGDKKKVKAPLNSSPWDKAIDTLKAIASAPLHWLGAGQLVGTHSRRIQVGRLENAAPVGPQMVVPSHLCLYVGHFVH